MDAKLTPGHLIDVRVEGEQELDESEIRRAADVTLARFQSPPVEVALVITGDQVLHELNQRYRGVDAPTDVLAFPDDTQGPFVGVEGGKHYLGDIVISYPRAVQQAAQSGHTPLAELQLLVVHGMLHLLGYDDQEESDRARMWAAQESVISTLEIAVNLPD